jgi:hypothetical protein
MRIRVRLIIIQEGQWVFVGSTYGTLRCSVAACHNKLVSRHFTSCRHLVLYTYITYYIVLKHPVAMCIPMLGFSLHRLCVSPSVY